MLIKKRLNHTLLIFLFSIVSYSSYGNNDNLLSFNLDDGRGVGLDNMEIVFDLKPHIRALDDGRGVGLDNMEIVFDLKPHIRALDDGRGVGLDNMEIVFDLKPHIRAFDDGRGVGLNNIQYAFSLKNESGKVVVNYDGVILGSKLKNLGFDRDTNHRSDDVGVIDVNGTYSTVPSSLLIDALNDLNRANIELTSEGVFKVGVTTTAALLVWKYGRRMNPIGALFIGLGIGPAAAADLCSQYRNQDGFDYFLSLEKENQFEVLSTCPEVAGKVLSIVENL